MDRLRGDPALSDERLCTCGHTAHWHGAAGCEHGAECGCSAFVQPVEGLERRLAQLDFVANARGYPGLEVAISGVEAVVDGVPQTVPADCECGHGIEAHKRGPCSGVTLEVEGFTYAENLAPAHSRASSSTAVQGVCACPAYDPAHEPREIAFKVERLVEVKTPGKAKLRRRGAEL